MASTSPPLSEAQLRKLARDAQDSFHFRWMSGMLDIKGRRIITVEWDRGELSRTVAKDGQQWVDCTAGDYCPGPDLSDPATQGCILHMLPERHVRVGMAGGSYLVVNERSGKEQRFDAIELALACALQECGPKDTFICPHCGSEVIGAWQRWQATADDPDDGNASLWEYRCTSGECEKQFWVKEDCL